MSIALARSFRLPVEVAGEAIGILAKRGAGKTNTGVVLVEEFHREHIQTVVLDPVGVWWGLRAASDGSSDDGLPIPVLGGEHGDVSLAATAGALIADVVVDTGQSLVLDLSEFSKTEQRRFVAEFATRLYRRKQRERSLLHIVLEEADEFAPQRVTAGDAPMVGAISLIVKRGRSRGLGITFITQRSASLNKDVLDQADVLIVMRTGGPRDRKAIEGWIEHQDVAIESDMLRSLPGLETGEAWVWNPERSIFERIKVRKRHTFDSSATPKAGQRRTEPRNVREIDLSKLGKQIEATAEKARENDPKLLRAEITKLRRALAERPAETVEKVVEKPVEVPVLTDKDWNALARLVQEFRALSEPLEDFVRRAGKTVEPIIEALERARSAPTVAPTRQPRPAPQPRVPKPEPVSALDASENGSDKLGRAERRILAVLGQYEGRSKKQVALLTGYSGKSGGFNNALAKLRTAGLITGYGTRDGDALAITAEGRAALGDNYEPLPEGEELLGYWFGRLGKAERTILQAVAGRYPESLSKAEVAEITGYSGTSGGFNNALSRLRTLELIHGFSDLTADPTLFEGAYD